MKHIPEIDGLRAIAVLSVLLYHVNAGWLSGGYVGVDVFFVISGYLISHMLMTDVAEGRLSLKRFYVRRILRIAPALFATLAVTALVFFALFPPVWSRDLLISLVALRASPRFDPSKFRPSILGKLTTASQLVAISFGLLFNAIGWRSWYYPLTSWIFYTVAVMVLVSGIHYFYRATSHRADPH